MRRFVLFLLSLCMIFSTSMIGFAQPIYVKTYKFENDIQMSGITSSTSKFFFVNNNWKVTDGKVNLVFTKSELLQIKDSTLTVYVNDTPIQSIRLDKNKEYKKSVEITIPTDLVIDGYNELKIRAYKTISDELCHDDANTANWLVIHKESSISIGYDYEEVKNELRYYPDIFMNTDTGLKINTAIVIPDEYTSGELKASMLLSANIGQRKKYETFQVEVERYSDFNNDKLNMIFIGKETNTPKNLLQMLSEEERSQLDNNAVLKLVDLPTNGKQLLLLSNQDELLEKGAKLLSNENYLETVSESTLLINEDMNVEEPPKVDGNRIHLKDLGYENIILSGPYSQAAELDINPSKNYRVSQGSKLHLNIRYANNLDFERSLATVYVNNIPIGSKKLSKEKSEGDELVFTLPEDVLGATYYQVRIVFHLELLDRGCVSRDTDNPWAFVTSDSYMDFVYGENDHATFKQYPAPFIENGQFNDLNLVTPTKMDSETLTDLGNIFAQMGRELTSNNGEFIIVTSDEAKEDNLKGNLLVYGTPEMNMLIKKINNQLHLTFSKDYQQFEPNEKASFTETYGAEVVSMQYIPSPFNKGKTMLVITSPKIESLHLSRKFLSDSERLTLLTGDAVLIDKNGNVMDLNYVEGIEKSDVEVLGEKLLTKEAKFFFAVASYVAITLILTVTLLFFKYRK